MNYKLGEYVKVIGREQTPADIKNGTFYPYFCGLAGTVERVYDDAVCVKVDCDSLPIGVRKRHTDIQDSIKQKWLNGLSGEARNRLTPEEKRFELSYTILVQAVDIEKAKQPVQVKPVEVKSTKQISASEPVAPETGDDLSAAELQYLREREQALKSEP